MRKSYFITGTDTGVGKTLVSCALLHAFTARGDATIGMKPVVTGCIEGEWADVKAIEAASSVNTSRELINPYAFIPPIAPHIAARQAGIKIDIDIIRDAYIRLQKKASIVIVEGVGGIMVPLNDYNDVADMIRILDLQVILVVGMRLGCLNHALLTARILQVFGLQVAGWIANQIDPQMNSFDENLYTLKKRLNFPLLGVFPFKKNAATGNFSTFIDMALLE